MMAICYSQFGLDDGGSRMLFTSSFAIAIVGSFIISLVVLAKIIVDRKNEKSIRMRDVLLGQKAYIEGYYDCRRRQINDEDGAPICGVRRGGSPERTSVPN